MLENQKVKVMERVTDVWRGAVICLRAQPSKARDPREQIPSLTRLPLFPLAEAKQELEGKEVHWFSPEHHHEYEFFLYFRY